MSTYISTSIKESKPLLIMIPGKEIPVGTYFTGTPRGHESSTFVRTFDSIVDLESPNKTWYLQDIEIINYLPLSSVAIAGIR